MSRRQQLEMLEQLQENTRRAITALYDTGQTAPLLPDTIRQAMAECQQRGCSYQAVNRAMNVGWQMARKEYLGKANAIRTFRRGVVP